MVIITNALYSASPRFVSRSGDRLSDKRFSCFSLVPIGKCWDRTSNLTTTSSFHTPSNSLINNQATIRRYIVLYIYPIYRVSQEKCARLREGVPYVKVYRYNPKHLCPKLNGYGDNGQRKVGGFLRFQILQPAQLIRHVKMLAALRGECSVHCACVTLCAVSHVTSPLGFLMYSACNPKDNYDTRASVFVVQFNGFMSLTS